MASLWSVEYFGYEGEPPPFLIFIPRLDLSQRAECDSIIGLLVKWGDNLAGEQSLTHTCSRGEFKEYRGALVRLFYVCKPRSILIIDGLLCDENGELFEAVRKKVEDYGESEA